MTLGQMGPSDDWGSDTGASQETQVFGCVICAAVGVIDTPSTIYIYNNQTLCMDHLQSIQSLETE